jgi:hypothetical protein
MTTVKAMIARLRVFDVDKEFKIILGRNNHELVKSQQKQMLHGLNSEGKAIGAYKGVIYAEEKYAMNPLAGKGIVDLNLTGDFYNAIFTDITGDSIIFDSSDSKSSGLESKYDVYGKIFGLNAASKKELINNVLLPDLLEATRQKTGMQ